MNRRGREVTQSLEELSHQVIGASMAVHTELGAGLLESTYEHCLLYELNKRGLKAEAQILSYLKMADKSLGLLINFNVTSLKQGIKRVVNNLDEKTPRNSASSAVQKRTKT